MIARSASRPPLVAPHGDTLNVNSTLAYAPEMAGYDLGPDHPMRPERVTLAVALMEAYGLVRPQGAPRAGAPFTTLAPAAATDEELELVHAPEYVATVREAQAHPEWFFPARAGLGTLDTPVFPGIHDVSALIAGGTIAAVRSVLEGDATRSFAPAGGLHHAHRAAAAGFCVYNDPAVAIAWALREHPDLRVLYLDIDAHHADGVQEAFWDEPRVLTLSVHETGMTLYPGTGFAGERGGAGALGSVADLPLPPRATDACYRYAWEHAVAPLALGFAPDVVVAQCGADALAADPLTSLRLSLPGYAWLARSLMALADALCAGRLVACGGGGYAWQSEVPRAWTALAAELCGATLPERLPDAWRRAAADASGVEQPAGLLDDGTATATATDDEVHLLTMTEAAVDELMAGA